jgi:exopolysaccharide biosynthesis polyprenyl glycosylphosphotransferase
VTDSEVLTAPAGAAAQPRPDRRAAVREVSAAPHGSWRRRYAASLLIGDIIGVLVLVGFVRWTEIDGSHTVLTPRFAGWLTVGVLTTLVALYATGSYEVRRIAVAVEEFRRLLHGVAVSIGVLAVIAVLAQVSLSRRVAVVDLFAMLIGLGLARYAMRHIVRRRRRHGQWTDRVLAVGSSAGVADLIRVLQRRPGAGLSVVATCLTDEDSHNPLPVPVIGGWGDVTTAAEEVRADVVAIAGGGHGARASRELGWALEGTGRQLVTALELSDVSRSRIDVRPVDGVPLAWVGHPQLTGPTRLVKRVMDLVLSSILLILVAPVFAVISLLIRTTSPGPVFFKQKRLGKDGELIKVWKFRTMIPDAEARRGDLVAHNMASNLLYFKVRDDPRITRVGSKLRRFSLDELPQLINVFLGSMSLVGPRPLPGDLDECDGEYRRRLLVKPGLTGLWQVSGRNDLPAEEALRLDLYYGENWSLGLDLMLLIRTAWAVIRKQGAY